MNYNNQGSVATQGAMDLGLRSFMLGTYKYMIAAMAVSGIVAYGFGNYVIQDGAGNITPIGRMLFGAGPALIMTIAIVVAFGAIGRKLPSMSLGAVKVFLFGFAAVMGVWLSSIAAFVDPMVSVRIFFMAAAMFAALSLFGYTTKRNLGPIATVAFMVFIGFVVMNLVGMFVPSMAMTGTMGTILSVVGLAAIAIITAWETQHLKQVYYGTVGNPELAEKYSAYGAASLLLSFINIFSILMSLFGDS